MKEEEIILLSTDHQQQWRRQESNQCESQHTLLSTLWGWQKQNNWSCGPRTMDTGNCIEQEYKSLNCRPHSSINNNIIGPQTLERCEDISIIRRDRAGYSSGGKYNTSHHKSGFIWANYWISKWSSFVLEYWTTIDSDCANIVMVSLTRRTQLSLLVWHFTRQTLFNLKTDRSRYNQS